MSNNTSANTRSATARSMQYSEATRLYRATLAYIDPLRHGSSLGASADRHNLRLAIAAYIAAEQRAEQSEKCLHCDQRTSYNGWTNRETWGVYLWISNDQPSYLAYQELATEAANTADAADAIKQCVEDGDPLQQGDRASDLYTDLLQCALDTVNWQEIAAALRADMEEQRQEQKGGQA